MKAFEHLIQASLRQGFSISVFSGGPGVDLSRSTSFRDIVEACEAVDEASLRIRDQDGKLLANVLVIPGLASDETIADWSATSKAATDWLDMLYGNYNDYLEETL